MRECPIALGSGEGAGAQKQPAQDLKCVGDTAGLTPTL